MSETDLVADIAQAVKQVNDDAAWKEDCITMLTFEEDMIIQRRIGIRKATEEGLAKGLAEGRAKGLAEGEERASALMVRLITDGRSEDALRAANDAEYRAGLFEEYGL